MKPKIAVAITILNTALLAACSNPQQYGTPANADAPHHRADAAKVNGTACNMTFAGIKFTKSVNGADTLIKINDNRLAFKVGEKKDYFSDPDGKLSNNTAPILLTQINNKRPFTLISKVTPTFTKSGLYNAGVLYIYVNDALYQKFCFEQDERGKHRVVTVRTIGTSDDNNHDVVERPFVYMKLSSDTKTVGSYYSLDNKKWHLVRLYKNTYPDKIWVGLSAQCPVDKGTVSYFDEVSLAQNSVSDFRMGN
jgi:regulation of enolase protein 1 (concanavalin A-like superfamily)